MLHVSGPESPARLTGATMADVDKLVFRIPAVALLASGVGLICVTPVAFAVPGLQVLYALPLAFAVWVVRLRTTVTAERIVARGLFGSRTVAWDDVKAVKLSEKSWLSVVLTDDKLVKLPAVRMMHLPALSAVSGGRITVPTAKAEEPADDEEPVAAVEPVDAPVEPVEEAVATDDADRERAERP
ncbi:PH domain-containing protein [Umezawaea endophytica]|uniref:PH domain-containing protein n=1 Tax=Umezawaea endophytica TaxID=1654476 RepID=A0A9X2VNX7_9PSEU|nr:PH domain-containing protein [Umezawaea endophytica]MCS7480171.1 PH domain-containing protein [Umezawaea endophytica]